MSITRPTATAVFTDAALKLLSDVGILVIDAPIMALCSFIVCKMDSVVSNVSVALACVVTSTNAGNIADSVAPGVTPMVKFSDAFAPTWIV